MTSPMISDMVQIESPNFQIVSYLTILYLHEFSSVIVSVTKPPLLGINLHSGLWVQLPSCREENHFNPWIRNGIKTRAVHI